MNIDEIINDADDADKVRVGARDLATWLLSNGISVATTGQVAELLRVPRNQVSQRLTPLRKRGLIVSPARGLWAPVPPEYGAWGAPPAIEIIDAIMRYMKVSYYVGWLSAAALSGASHHAPQVFQVATSRTVRARDVGRSKIRFYHRSHIGTVPVIYKETRSGQVAVSATETTLLDIASDTAISGGLDNVANIVIELCEDNAPDMEILVETASHYPVAAIRRLGWLIENFTAEIHMDSLYAHTESRATPPTKLLPSSSHRGRLDRRWNMYINTEVNPDL
jgi:predicted transcriptional regulator of viral defense system